MRKQSLNLVSVNSLYERSFLQTTGYGNNEVHKNRSYEGLSFVCSILPDACSAKRTNYP